MQFIDWGLIDYQQAWDKQNNVFETLQKYLQENMEITPQMQQVIFCEHPHVYTLGKNGQTSNLLINEKFLEKINATFYRIDRGGDITYHGPGQIVGYPILYLQQLHLSLKEYIFQLEETIINTLKEFLIIGERLNGATGVWIDAKTSNARKICAIGVRASRYITMHGFALNINTDLSYYNHINPCGFIDKGVTSLQKELGMPIDIEDVKNKIQKHFLKGI